MRRATREIWRFGLVPLLLAALAMPAQAWGPHTEITLAALAVLPARVALAERLGDDWLRQARDYCWMGDWREAPRADHYADDYLLFRHSPAHVSHMLPEVRQTYAPFFRRALQAVHTESPPNAARWVGSLLHFVQDSGSPPHTTGIGGELHGRMERWVDETQITIAGYEPRLLGRDEREALRAFEARMESLIAFSRERAVRLKPLVENLKERANQPLELECALETARVSADVLHTLYTLGLAADDQDGCRLEGRIIRETNGAATTYPARVWLAETDYATTTDAQGRFAFRNLPSGRYRLAVLTTGYEFLSREVDLSPESPVQLELSPERDEVAGNLVRNPRLEAVSIRSGKPDWWSRDPLNKNRWASALVRVPVSQRVTLSVRPFDKQPVAVTVRWRTNPSTTAGSQEDAVALQRDVDTGRLQAWLDPPERLTPFEPAVLFLEVLVDSERGLTEVCRHVAVTLATP